MLREVKRFLLATRSIEVPTRAFSKNSSVKNCQQAVDCQKCFSFVTRLSRRSANKPSFSRTSRTIQPSSYTRLCPCQRRRKPPPSCNRYSPHVHRAAAQLCRENRLFGRGLPRDDHNLSRASRLAFFSPRSMTVGQGHRRLVFAQHLPDNYTQILTVSLSVSRQRLSR
jgi:hypothetical protein